MRELTLRVRPASLAFAAVAAAALLAGLSYVRAAGAALLPSRGMTSLRRAA